MIRGAIFDLGSTLIRFEGDWSEAIEASVQALADKVERFGIVLDRQDLVAAFRQEMQAAHRDRESDYIERPTWELLRKVLEDLGHQEVSMSILGPAVEAMYRVTERGWQPVPGVHQVLDRLRQAGCRLGLISNAGDEGNVRRLIDKAQVRPYFDPVLISACEGIRKPDPRLFDTVLRAWGLPPQHVAMVGDNLGADILGGQKSGLYTIWLSADADTPENLALKGSVIPDTVAESLTEAGDIILRLLAPSAGDPSGGR